MNVVYYSVQIRGRPINELNSYSIKKLCGHNNTLLSTCCSVFPMCSKTLDFYLPDNSRCVRAVEMIDKVKGRKM